MHTLLARLFSCCIALTFASATQAEVTAMSACSYFALSETHVAPDTSQQLIKGKTVVAEPYQLVSTDLKRYQVWVVPDFARTLSRIGNDDREIPTTAFSATVNCLVDAVDRRVLRISYSNGPSVGLSLVSLEFNELSNIKNPALKVIGVVPMTYEIGNKTHQGKY